MRKIYVRMILFGGLIVWAAALVWACSSDFTQPPVGSSIGCDPSSATATVPPGSSATLRITATVKGQNGVNVNHASVTIFANQGLFFDVVTGAPIAPGAAQFITQTNDQGFLQVDFSCASSAEGNECNASFDIGVASCTTDFTVTDAESGT